MFTFFWQLLGHLLMVAKKVADECELESGYRLGNTLLNTS